LYQHCVKKLLVGYLAACGWQINTAFIERVNLSIRQHVAAVGRRVTTLCKGEVGMRQQLVLYHVYYNFCLPHASLRVPLAASIPTNGTGSAGSLPCLRPAHHIDSKGLRSGIDLRRIPHKMLEPLASHKEEPDAWILSVSKPGLHYQNSG
jgi:hypothetical protein